MRNLREWVRQNLGLGQLGEGVIQLLAYGVSFLLVSYVIGYLKTPAHLREMKKGYAEISDDWKDFSAEWANSDIDSAMVDGARVVVRYLPENDLAELYRMRAEMFARFSSEQRLMKFCSVSRNLPPDGGSIVEEVPGEIFRYMGRAYALRRINNQEWVPRIDLENEEYYHVIFGLVEAFERLGAARAAEVFRRAANSENLTPEQMCHFQEELYWVASQHPDERIESHRLLEVVRTIDYSGSQ